MKKIDGSFHLLTITLALVSLSIAYFGFAFIESGTTAYEVFGATSFASTIAIGVGLFMSVLQVGFVFGGIAVAYINEIYNK